MDKNFFKKTRILDGGMGQEILNRGVKPHGAIWGATALLHKKYHSIVVDVHLDFIKAGAEVIVTNSFGSRKKRLIENNLKKINLNIYCLINFCVIRSNIIAKITIPVPPMTADPISNLPRAT